LTEGAALALDAAVVAASKAGHPETTRDHLLRELLAVHALWPTLRPVRFHRRELSSFTEARLQRLPSTKAYRDAGARPRLASALIETLEASGRGVLFFRREIDEGALTDALLEDPEIIALARRLRGDVSRIDDLIDRATRLAGSQNHGAVGIAHALRVALEEPWLARALDVVGGDSAVRAPLETSLEGPPGAPGTKPVPSRALADILRRANAHAKSLRRPATADLLVVFALQHAGGVRLCEAAGISAWDLLATVVHGGPLPVGAADTHAVEIVFHDDDATTREFVLELLSGTFGCELERAAAKVREIQAQGSAVVASYPHEEAAERAATALASAREAGFPLRITLRAAR